MTEGQLFYVENDNPLEGNVNHEVEVADKDALNETDALETIKASIIPANCVSFYEGDNNENDKNRDRIKFLFLFLLILGCVAMTFDDNILSEVHKKLVCNVERIAFACTWIFVSVLTVVTVFVNAITQAILAIKKLVASWFQYV
jgi:hypothetical protein